MGLGSGSGKTTLLNVIANRFDNQSFKVEQGTQNIVVFIFIIIIGSILYCRSNKQINCKIGYVTQNDYLLPFLTVQETILYSAIMKIKSNSSVNSEEKINFGKLVDDIILELGLRECANSRIGLSLRIYSI